MKRKFWIGASFSALVIAAMAPWSASQANGVSIRVSTPEFGIRIGAPHFPPPVLYPVLPAAPLWLCAAAGDLHRAALRRATRVRLSVSLRRRTRLRKSSASLASSARAP